MLVEIVHRDGSVATCKVCSCVRLENAGTIHQVRFAGPVEMCTPSLEPLYFHLLRIDDTWD